MLTNNELQTLLSFIKQTERVKHSTMLTGNSLKTY